MTPRRPRQSSARGPRVVVIGAGAFGGWTALELLRRGARVTLIDAWGPGHARSSSGGETRVIRATYGSHRIYTTMAKRALELWREHDRRWQRGFFRQTGALWLFGKDNSFGRASADALRADGIPVEMLTAREASKRYPQISFTGLSSALVEPEAGYLLARRACEFVAERVLAEGGEYRHAAAASPVRVDGALKSLALSDGTVLRADAFVFACGPWLPALFPEVLGRLITPTKQDVYYFGTPAGDDRFSEGRLPIWLEVGERMMYGLPGNANRGFKISDDAPGPRFDPTNGRRDVAASGLKAARAFIARRFPALADAPYIGSEVCQYESSADSNYIIDVHPHASNVWLAGAGSGHGFKMGPVIGEMVAGLVFGESKPDPAFALARFAKARTGAQWQKKWS